MLAPKKTTSSKKPQTNSQQKPSMTISSTLTKADGTVIKRENVKVRPSTIEEAFGEGKKKMKNGGTIPHAFFQSMKKK